MVIILGFDALNQDNILFFKVAPTIRQRKNNITYQKHIYAQRIIDVVAYC